jgi:2-polyprenyl-6-methoxyphenol hydroxylase-like FAD-dependent oxidoreductase
MPAMNQTDIVIAGGGIGGAVLAALLAEGGKRVTIAERATGPPPFLRPELLWPPAVRILERIRPLEFWERDCLRRAEGLYFYRGGRRQAFATAELFERAGVQPYFEHPNNLRETLLAICGAEVRRGVEVIGLLREDGRVCGVTARDAATGLTEEITADLTIGDDGGGSAVRAAIGVPCELRPFPVEFYAASQPWPENWPAREVRVFLPAKSLPGGMLGFGMMPLPGRVAACLGLVSPSGEESRLAEAFAILAEENPDIPSPLRACGFPTGFKPIGRSFGLAPSYGVPGCVLIGDAIHPVSPAGGQGANMAVGDAACLAGLILDGSPDPAGSLREARLAAHKRGLRPSRLAAAAFGIGRVPVLGSLTRGIASLAASSENLRIRVLQILGMG